MRKRRRIKRRQGRISGRRHESWGTSGGGIERYLERQEVGSVRA